MIFVFGSNLAGVHGAGAAKCALDVHGAIWGQGIGHQGNSYAIPTKDEHIKTLPLARIWSYVLQFMAYAKANKELKFEVTRIGCGLAGYTDKDISPMFEYAPENCELPTGWRVDPNLCPFVSRAWGCRCDLKKGHEELPSSHPDFSKLCVSKGDGFTSGFHPIEGERK